MRRIEGEVLALSCAQCAEAFHSFEFSGDTDMPTSGLAAATALRGDWIALAEMSPEEWDAGLRGFTERLGRELGAEFRTVPLLRVGAGVSPPPGASFRAFRRTHVAPRLVYGCPHCSGEAEVTGRQGAAEFQSAGGRVTLLGDLALA